MPSAASNHSAIKGHLEQGGHGYHCSSDYRDVIETLKGWGVLREGIQRAVERKRGSEYERGRSVSGSIVAAPLAGVRVVGIDPAI